MNKLNEIIEEASVKNAEEAAINCINKKNTRSEDEFVNGKNIKQQPQEEMINKAIFKTGIDLSQGIEFEDTDWDKYADPYLPSNSEYTIVSNGTNGIAPGRHTLDPNEAHIPYKLGLCTVRNNTDSIEHASIFDGEYLYIVGGVENRTSSEFKDINTIRRYNIATRDMEIVGHLPIGLGRPFIVPKKAVLSENGACQFEGFYIMGGFINDDRSNCNKKIYYYKKGENYVEDTGKVTPRGLFECCVVPKGDGNHIIQYGCYEGNYVNRNRYLFNEDTMEFTTLTSISSSDYVHTSYATYLNFPIYDEEKGEGTVCYGIGGTYNRSLFSATYVYKNGGTTASEIGVPLYNRSAFSSTSGRNSCYIYRMQDESGEYKVRIAGGYTGSSYSNIDPNAYDLTWDKDTKAVTLTKVTGAKLANINLFTSAFFYHNNELYYFGGGRYKYDGSHYYGYEGYVTRYGTVYPVACSPSLCKEIEEDGENLLIYKMGYEDNYSFDGSITGLEYNEVYRITKVRKCHMYMYYYDVETKRKLYFPIDSTDFVDDDGYLKTKVKYSDVSKYFNFETEYTSPSLLLIAEVQIPELYGEEYVMLQHSGAGGGTPNYVFNLEKEDFYDDLEWEELAPFPSHVSLSAIDYNTHQLIDYKDKIYIFLFGYNSNINGAFRYYVFDKNTNEITEHIRKNAPDSNWSDYNSYTKKGILVDNKYYMFASDIGYFYSLDLEDDLYLEQYCGIRQGLFENVPVELNNKAKQLTPFFIREGKVNCILYQERNGDYVEGCDDKSHLTYLLSYKPGDAAYTINEIDLEQPYDDGWHSGVPHKSTYYDFAAYYDERSDRLYTIGGSLQYTYKKNHTIGSNISGLKYYDMKTYKLHDVVDNPYYHSRKKGALNIFRDRLIYINGDVSNGYAHAGTVESFSIDENGIVESNTIPKKLPPLQPYCNNYNNTIVEGSVYNAYYCTDNDIFTDDKIYALRKTRSRTGQTTIGSERYAIHVLKKKEKQKKYLYEKDGQVYYNDNKTLVPLNTTPTMQDYIEKGDTHPNANVITEGVSVLMFVVDGNSSDDGSNSIVYNCTLPGETVIMDFDLSSRCTSSIKTLCSENAKFLLSTDGGSTWKTSTDGFTLKTCNIDTIKENGMSSEVLSNLAEETLNSLRNQDRIRFAIFLEQDDIDHNSFVDHITLR